MPLRDHFRPPVWNQASWEGFHGGWPMMMVLNLAPKLPKGFAAEPRVHLGTYFEIDVCTFDKNGERDRHSDPDPVTNGGVATATLAPPAPTLTVDVDFPDQYVYEVLIFDQRATVSWWRPWRSLAPQTRTVRRVANCSSRSAQTCCETTSASPWSIWLPYADSTCTRSCLPSWDKRTRRCPRPATDLCGHLSQAPGGPKDEVGHLGPPARRRSIVAAVVHLADGNLGRVA